MKTQTGELEEAGEAVVQDIQQLGKLVSITAIAHLIHNNQSGFK